MKIVKPIVLTLFLASLAAMVMTACSDTKSYAELLTDENHDVNAFLVNHRVVGEVPADSVFEVGPNAPYYCLDEEKNVYMQVLNPGTKDNRVANDQQIYFRFTRYNLQSYDSATNEFVGGSYGNSDDMSMGSTSFRYGNYTLTSSSQWGSGIQMPLAYLGIDCEVNLVIKSQYGMTSEIAQVMPFLYNVRYFPALSE